jgi:hypothetical protein
MANQLVDDAKKAEAAATANAAPPSDAQLRAELEAERKGRAEAEQRAGFFQGAASAEWRRAEALKSQPPRNPADPLTDPFAKIAAEDAMLDPERKAKLLDEGTRSRAREEVNKAATEMDARNAARMADMESRVALRMFQSQNPEMAADEEGFFAAMAKAKIRADKGRMSLDPMGMLELGRQIYNEGKATPAATPFTESATSGAPAGARVKKDEVPEKSYAEEVYGAQDFIDESKIPVSDYTEKWLDNRNLELVDKEKFWSGIRNVQGDIQGAKSRKRAAGR